MRKSLQVLIGIGAIAGLGAVVFWPTCEPTVLEPARESDAGTPSAVKRPDAGVDPPTEPWLVVEPQQGSFVALVDGEPVAADFTIGGAGIYPPLHTQGAQIAMPTPSATMSGEALDTLEMYARSVDGKHAYWGDISVDANAVELSVASPVTVQVVDEAGHPISAATVRLGREVVGLVLLSVTTDANGAAEFAAIPAGDFVVTAEALGARVEAAQVGAGESVTLVALRGREVLGVVRSPDGRPVADATVAIHGADVGANPLDDVPADIVATNLLGEFRATGVPGAQFVAVALAAGWAPTQSIVVAPETGGPARLDITLLRGFTVHATAVDENSAPVPHAKVEWRDDASAMGATMLAGDDGRATFEGVPLSADLFATLDRFESPRVSLKSLPASNKFDVELRLTNSDSRIWRYRVHVPKEVVLRDLEIHDSTGVRCSVSTSDGRDFVATGCGDGTASFRASTDRGFAEWDAGKFVDGTDVTMPAPVLVKIAARGRPDEQWESTVFSMLGSGVTVPVTVEAQPFGRHVTTSVYPGQWRFLAINQRIGALPFTLRVDDQPFELSIELVALRTFRLRVVDAYGAPVTGAYAMLFSNDRLVDASRSAGQLPTEFRVRPPFDGEILVVDPRRGEGRVAMSTSGDDDRPEVRLRASVLTLPVPTPRPTREALAKRLGGTLVERDRGVVVDFDGATAGTRAGLQRGDFLVSAWPEGSQLRVVAYRQGHGYIDVALP